MHTQVGSCPHCGAPLYSPSPWFSITPPPVTYTCGCVPQPRVITTTKIVLDKTDDGLTTDD